MVQQQHDWILILDFGSQYTQLIARRLRELKVYCEIHPFNTAPETFSEHPPSGIVFSGGPLSVNDNGAPQPAPGWLDPGVPLLGICYGLQAIAHASKPGSVARSARREFGRARLILENPGRLFKNITEESLVWMSHSDKLEELPEEFEITARTENAPVAAVQHKTKPVFGVQFHPEVVHTECGRSLLANFAFEICGLSGDWTPASFIEETTTRIKETVGSEKVVCALSGGVDSTVTAKLIHEAIGDQLLCIFVDNGLLRKGEFEEVLHMYRTVLKLPVEGLDRRKLFMSRLHGISDPEEKRKIIGNTFIDVFDEAVAHDSSFKFLAQGTLYPDVIESVSFKGPSATIKSHHNVGGLPEKMNLKLIEPMRELFKDEVRTVGRSLGIPESFIGRHPFPGPGLGIRVLGALSEEKLDLLREADAIFIQSLREHGLYDSVWQALTVLLPVQSVGVMGDERTYEFTAALRAVTSIDGMTADWAHLPHDFLAEVSGKIINQVEGINRVVYDISSKPPSTIEWE